PSTGGRVSALGGAVTLEVPAGAFTAGSTLKVSELAAAPEAGQGYRGLSPVYDIETSQQPRSPVTLRLKAKLPDGLDPRKAAVYRQAEDGAWQYVGGRLNRTDGTLAASVDHFSRYAVLAYEPSFGDLAGHWAQGDVAVLAARHVVAGMAPGSFAPESPVTRAQMIKLLVEALRQGNPALRLAGGATPFADVPAAHWAAPYVATAAQLGIARGDGNAFRPEDPVTRQELAALIARALGETGKADGAVLAGFADRDAIAPWARDAAAHLVARGIIQGVSDSSFAPEARATRAQAAVMVLRLLDRQGWLEEATTLEGTLRVSEVEGRHYELETAGGTWVLLADPRDAWLQANLAAAVGKRVRVTGAPHAGPTIYQRGPALRLTSVTPLP
ncbi:MAG: S-layer homology domain-containing protein, partial [Clostridia bacterium]|nr:S-layer homology domain-containing protein [Clostridia bacterium]